MRACLAIVAVSGLLLSATSVRGQGTKTPEADPVSLLVSVSQRLLTVQRGEQVFFQFPVGVGTGDRLSGDRLSGAGAEEWTFTTPIGVFEIGRKKKDPIWYAPDWYYVERGRSIPPAYSDERYRPGILGDYALYLSDEIAIHGTEDESSVGRASSHGCLRMRNADIAVVFPLVEVGTRVDIVP